MYYVFKTEIGVGESFEMFLGLISKSGFEVKNETLQHNFVS